MGEKLTKAEIDGLNDLKALGSKAIRSRAALRTISSLMDKGLIEFDIGEGATLTDKGQKAITTPTTNAGGGDEK